MNDPDLIDRELSWLSFNYRVLQEARDKTTPLLERLKFLAIFSSNLDEFYRVRVAGIKHLIGDPKESSRAKILLADIQKTVNKYLNDYGATFWQHIKPELEKENIFIITDQKLHYTKKQFVKEYFEEHVKAFIQPGLLAQGKIAHFLKNNALYLIVQLVNIKKPDSNKYRYAFIEIPSQQVPRFVELPSSGNKKYVMFLDDIIRFNLHEIFIGYQIKGMYSVKLTRDADLYIEDEFQGSLLKKIQKSLHKRAIGKASRFLYDGDMPKVVLKYLQITFDLGSADMVKGGRYHNFSDFFTFPNFTKSKLIYPELPALKIDEFERSKTIVSLIKQKDMIVSYPYQSYEYIIRFLNEAVKDRAVSEIYITLYRVASNSRIVDALCRASVDGIKVNVFVELKARFDEASNITAYERLIEAGANVKLSIPDIKVHSKLCMIVRNEKAEKRYYTYLATGNFNEKTSRIYADHGLFTNNEVIANDILNVFKFLMDGNKNVQFKQLLVAPFNLRNLLELAIDNEIGLAKSGKKASIIIKVNSLEDPKMIRKLYEASQAGVKIQLIVRGICCLKPGVQGLSENISAISIVDRFLEHSRTFIFRNDGEQMMYLGSADIMRRNLNRRVEIVFPVLDKDLQKQISKQISIQLKDNVKARKITVDSKNEYVKNRKKALRSQYATYDLLNS